MILKETKNIIKKENDFHLHFCLDKNTTDASDGEYFLKESCADWHSDSKVKVRGGLIDIKSLIVCTKEVLKKSKYHGRYLEHYKFDGKYFVISIGS